MDRTGIFETLVGAAVVAVAGLFAVYAYGLSGKDVTMNAYQIDAIFGRVDGVAAGSEVRIAGMKVGSVVSQRLDPKTYEARLRLAIASNVAVPEDSVAKIVADGVLGGAHVAIEPGAAEEMLREGDVITITQGSVDLLGLAMQAFTDQSGAKVGGRADSGGDSGDNRGDDSDSGQSEIDPLGDL